MLLYIGESMYETLVENLSHLANLISTYGSIFMITEGLDIASITGIAAILVLLTGRRMTRRRRRGSVTSRLTFGRRVKGQPVLKPCPSCAERLPLSAIICGTCDYNFLAERPGRGQNLLPSPEPMTHEAPEHKFSSVML